MECHLDILCEKYISAFTKEGDLSVVYFYQYTFTTLYFSMHFYFDGRVVQ